jgi:uncharacterized protein (TIGR02284 family)
MKKTDTTKLMLNDLLRINTERVERYKRASYEILDSELKSVFYTMADESRKNMTEINTYVNKHYGEPDAHAVVKPGKIYRSWIDVNSKFNGTLRNQLLTSCEFGELATIASYTMAKMETRQEALLELLDRQYESLKSSHEVVKSYRQAYDKLDKVPR